MKCFDAPETDLHDPVFRLTNGKIQRNAERAERARLLRAGLEQLGLATETPPEAPRSTLEAVHTAQFLHFLETAWEEWQKLPDCGPEVVPNVFANRAIATYPDSIVARAGPPLGEGQLLGRRRGPRGARRRRRFNDGLGPGVDRRLVRPAPLF